MVHEEQRPMASPGTDTSLSLGELQAINFKVLGDRTSGAYSVVEHVLMPGQLGSPLHAHANEDEVSIVLEGEMGVLIGDEVISAGVGSYVVKPRGVPHAFWNSGSTPARFAEIISPPGFEQYFVEAAAHLATDGPPDMEGLSALAARYGLTMYMERLPELMERFNVRLGE